MDEMMKCTRAIMGSLALSTASCLVPPPDLATGDSGDSGSTTSGSGAVTAGRLHESGASAFEGESGARDESSGSTTTAESTTDASATAEGETETGQPNGYYPCYSDEDCASGVCFSFGVLGAICSECKTDADCAAITGFGCTPPDIGQVPYEPAHCNMGELGGGCMSSGACADGLTCESILDIGFVWHFHSCSACATHDDCAAGELCSPTIIIEDVAGYLACEPLGSVPIGGTCDFAADGDLVCASGACARASIDGFAYIGVCSECDEDADCPDGLVCRDASVGTADVVIIPAACMAPG